MGLGSVMVCVVFAKLTSVSGAEVLSCSAQMVEVVLPHLPSTGMASSGLSSMR
jgi:hypothetical protein